MSLLSDLENKELLRTKTANKCSVCTLLEVLDPKEAAALQAVLNDPTVPKAAVARVLNANGHDVKSGTLTRHTRQECQSPKG
jgi:hypothetical protein